MTNKEERFAQVYERLLAILKPYEEALVVMSDKEGDYTLYTPYSEVYDKEMFFGAVQTRKRYVSFHLMPVYVYPDLLDDMPPGLGKRMQGKSCFNFTKVDEDTLADLETLTRRGFERFKEEQVI